jgi:DNA-binding transcriptional ArsR family regulator
MSLLPRFVDSQPAEPRVLDVDGDEADRAFEALSSETARTVLGVLYEEPSTPTEVREEVGTSLQNVHYHLDKLEDAGLIEPAGTGYSETGNEMTVYGPASEAVVLFAGRESARSRLSDVLARVLGLYVVLAVATIALAVAVDYLEGGFQRATGGDGGGAVAMSTEAAPTAGAAGGPALGPEPALLFFLGGCVVLAGLAAWWYVREVRPVR